MALSWTRCCAPRDEGGLGIRSLVTANKAFLMRLAWDLMRNSAPACSLS